MSSKTHKIILVLILLLASFTRIYRIASYPSLNSDEAAIGYNSYSLLQTGKDEHGLSWPIHFKSFGDYKPGGYFYLTLPFIKALGLTPLAVRLPNIILSLISIFFFYKIIETLTKNKSLALTSAFILSISPWHIHFSRGAWESSTALSFTLMAVYFFLKEKYFLYVFFLSASLYTYHSSRLVSPLLALLLLVIYWQKLKKIFPKLILPVIFGVIICLPVLYSFLQNGGTSRFSGVGLLADKGPISRSEELLNHHGNTLLLNRITHNKRILYLLSWGQKYFSHFDFSFLFIDGDQVPRSKTPEMGQAYLIEIPLFIIGFFILINSKKINRQTRWLFIFWLLLSPIASSLTFQAPSALRSLPMVIPLSFFISLGLYSSVIYLKSRLYSALLILLYLFSFSYYFDSYFIHYQKRYPYAWEYGFSEVIPYIESQKQNYPAIYLTDTYDQPYIYYLFYTRYNPQKLHPQIKLTPPDQYGFSTVSNIDNIFFERINWQNIPSGSLVISGNEDVPFVPLQSFYSPSGQPLFNIYVK